MDDALPTTTAGERFVTDVRGGPAMRGEAGRLDHPVRPGDDLAVPATTLEPPSVPDGTFVKVRQHEHPLPRACEVTVNFQDYHRSSSKLGRFGKVIGIDEEAGEYLIMLDNFESVSVPMHRVEWRKRGT